MTRRKGCWLRGSYTVEAALLVPLFLFSMMKGLMLGVDCYHDVRIASQTVEHQEDIEPAERIWKSQLARKGVDFLHEHTISEESEE